MLVRVMGVQTWLDVAVAVGSRRREHTILEGDGNLGFSSKDDRFVVCSFDRELTVNFIVSHAIAVYEKDCGCGIGNSWSCFAVPCFCLDVASRHIDTVNAFFPNFLDSLLRVLFNVWNLTCPRDK